jgi:hypothetical protein
LSTEALAKVDCLLSFQFSHLTPHSSLLTPHAFIAPVAFPSHLEYSCSGAFPRDNVSSTNISPLRGLQR